jgi:hypothetical protein
MTGAIMQLVLLIAIPDTDGSWVYDMKLKSDMLKVVKKWLSDIADLRQKIKLSP